MSRVSLARTALLPAALLAALALTAPAARAADWVVHLLPTLGGTKGAAHGINAQGDVVGDASTADGVRHPVRWRDGAVKVLADGEGSALAINDKGAIVLRMGEPSFLWRPGHPLQYMGDLAYPHQINNHGTMAGSRGNGDAAVFTKTSVIGLAGLPDNYLSYALHVNDHGVAVGACLVNPGTEPTLWKNGEAIQLPVLGSFGEATSVNLKGTIVGHTWDWGESSPGRAVRWQHLQPIALPSPSAAMARAVNESDEIVGVIATAGGHWHAAYWHDDRLVDLDDQLPWALSQAGWHLVTAEDINDAGWIVGLARNAKTGEGRAFLMTR